MSLKTNIFEFVNEDSGAVTVDWTVLSAAAVSLALATTAYLTDVIDMVSGTMDNELRSRQLSDDWVAFLGSHYNPILETGYLSEENAELLHGAANELMNHDVITILADGIEALENGTITTDQIVELVAIASIANQRNLVDDAMLNHYFGFDGSDPFYMTVANAPADDGSGNGYAYAYGHDNTSG